MSDEKKIAELVSEKVSEALTGLELPEFAIPDEFKADLAQQLNDWRDQAQAEFRAEMERQKHAFQIAELARGLAEGVDGAERGLPVKADELADHLLKIDAEEAGFWIDLMQKIQRGGVVEFGEDGHGKDAGKKVELPAEYAEKLDAGVIKIAELSNPLLGLGDLAQYDLAKWQE